MKNSNSDKKYFQKLSEVWKFSEVPKLEYFPKVIRRPFASNATSCMTQQLLLRY